MDFETILYSVAQGIATLTLNRPRKRNALDLVMRREIAAAVQAASRDDAVRALVVTGAGEHFCSGGDIAAMQERPPGADAGRQRMRDNWDWTQELIYLGKPVIAAVDGGAVGGGFSMALMADFIIASQRAYFCFSFSRIGLVPDLGGMYMLPRMVGLQCAKEIVFSARNVPAQEAKDLGIVYRIVPAENLQEEAEELARRLSAGSAATMGMAKSILNSSFHNDLRTVLDLEASANGIGFESAFHREAISSFLRKEPFAFQSFSANDPATK
jgi:2-(1,2-epoxy-1,2-dihydrophenyl)acetyl-CoA isomerase